MQQPDYAISSLPLVSYPGFLTPVFVLTRGEGLVQLVMCSDVHGRWVDMRDCM